MTGGRNDFVVLFFGICSVFMFRQEAAPPSTNSPVPLVETLHPNSLSILVFIKFYVDNFAM